MKNGENRMNEKRQLKVEKILIKSLISEQKTTMAWIGKVSDHNIICSLLVNEYNLHSIAKFNLHFY